MKTFKEYIKENTEHMDLSLDEWISPYIRKDLLPPNMIWYENNQTISKTIKLREPVGNNEESHIITTRQFVLLGELSLEKLPKKNQTAFLHLKGRRIDYTTWCDFSSPSCFVYAIIENGSLDGVNIPNRSAQMTRIEYPKFILKKATYSHKNINDSDFLYCPFHYYNCPSFLRNWTAQVKIDTDHIQNNIIREIAKNYYLLDQYIECVQRGKEGYVDFFMNIISHYLTHEQHMQILELLKKENMMSEDDYDINYAVRSL